MKKLLLLASAASLACGSAYADVPQEYPNYGFCGFSPDGTTVVSSLSGTLTILDLTTGDDFVYSDEAEAHDVGTGNFISNNGVVVGQVGGAYAAWWQNGKWNDFDETSASRMSIAHGVTRNGTRVVGAIAPDNYSGDYEGMMLTPCYWDVQTDGTFGEVKYLPYPSKDLTGRTPQYVTAVSVSEDGKTIAGQIVDFAGAIYQPIIYTQDANGDWTYSTPLAELYHPEGFELPEDPGESPNVQPETFMSQEEREAYDKAVQEYYDFQDSLFFPEAWQFMTDEEYAAYQAALDEYYETWENYPDEQDYMTEEEYAAYQAAVEKYYEDLEANVYPEYKDYMTEDELAAYRKAQEEMEVWDEKWAEFSEAFNRLCEIVPSFVFNNMFLSPDGSTLVTTFSKEMMNWDTWTFISENYPWVIDIKNNTYTAYDEGEMLIASSVSDDGVILARTLSGWENPATYAYILEPNATEFVPLYDFIAAKDASVAAWMKENMTHTYENYVLDEETWEYDVVLEEVMPTGIPFANSDMSVIALTVENFWDYDPIAYGYIISSEALGVKSVAVTDDAVGVAGILGGVLQFTGDVASATVYDLTGAAVYKVNSPAATISTGLAHGIYVVKAVATNGSVTTAKVAL